MAYRFDWCRLQVNFLPEADKYDRTKTECYAEIDVAMGGKAAEELIFGHENVRACRPPHARLSLAGVRHSCSLGRIRHVRRHDATRQPVHAQAAAHLSATVCTVAVSRRSSGAADGEQSAPRPRRPPRA